MSISTKYEILYIKNINMATMRNAEFTPDMF